MVSLRAELFTINMVCMLTAFCTQLLSDSKYFNNMLLDFSKQCIDVMYVGKLEQHYNTNMLPTMWAQKTKQTR